MNRKCSDCGNTVPTDKLRCPYCKSWVLVDAEFHSDKRLAPTTEDDGTVLLSRVTSADDARIELGPFSKMWGPGGAVKSSTTLLAGTPGAGKSTGLMQILAIIVKQYNEGEVLYVAAEESLPEIRLRADRLKIDCQDRIRMIGAMKGVENLGLILLSRKPLAVVLDSIQGLTMDDVSLQKSLCKQAKEYAVELEAPFFLISHVNKGGEIAGVETLQHEVDTTMLLSGEKQEPRLFEVCKNRFGRCESMILEMGPRGLIVAPDDSDGYDDELD